VAAAESSPPRLPKVPAYAWSWLQRSRPVLAEAARRLTGAPPAPGFAEDLQRRWDTDPFLQGVVLDVIADVAFRGRVPAVRPPGVSWDRGLTWWAAMLAGVTPQAYDAAARGVQGQRALFPDPPTPGAAPPAGAPPGPPLTGSHERRALAQALRDLLRASDGQQVPADAVRRLLADLET
jgi:hypothetical protein